MVAQWLSLARAEMAAGRDPGRNPVQIHQPFPAAIVYNG